MSTSSTSTNATNKKDEPRELPYDTDASNATGETPATQSNVTATVAVKETRGKKGGKKGTKGSDNSSTTAKADTEEVPAALRQALAEARCGFCNNPLSEDSEGVKVVEVDGKKVPKDVDGQYIYETPGVKKGTMAGVLCGTCASLANDVRYVKPDGRAYVDVKHVLVVRKSGGIANIPVSDLDQLSAEAEADEKARKAKNERATKAKGK